MLSHLQAHTCSETQEPISGAYFSQFVCEVACEFSDNGCPKGFPIRDSRCSLRFIALVRAFHLTNLTNCFSAPRIKIHIVTRKKHIVRNVISNSITEFIPKASCIKALTSSL